MDGRGRPWVSKDIHGPPCIPTKIKGYPWISTVRVTILNPWLQNSKKKSRKTADKGVASWGLPERRKMNIGVNGAAELGVAEKKKESENISFNRVAGLNEKEKWKLKLSGMVGGDPQRKKVIPKYQRRWKRRVTKSGRRVTVPSEKEKCK